MKAASALALAFAGVCMLSACATAPRVEDRLALQFAEGDAERLIVVTLRNDVAAIAPRAGSTPRTYGAPARYAVAPATEAQGRSVAASYKLKKVAAWPIGLLGVHCLVFELPAGSDRAVLLERLRRDPRIESAQPLNSFRTLTAAPDQSYRTLQADFAAMNLAGAHRWSRGEDIRVAIVDTGVDREHPDLRGRIAHYRDFAGGAGRSADAERHGTAVAGIIAASGDNPSGIVGIAPAARLYALRACWSDAHDSNEALCNTLTLAKALVAAIDARVHVVNLSLGGPTDPLLARLVKAGLARGIVFVGALPPAARHQTFPTAIPGVIGVDVLGSSRNADAALLAPGREVLTLAPNGSYDFLSGSSLSAASISGAAALLLACDKRLGADDIRTLLAASGRSAPAGVDLCLAVAGLVPKASCD